jgi:ankyrin repeat protein
MRTAAILVCWISVAAAQQPAKASGAAPAPIKTGGAATRVTPPQYAAFRPENVSVTFKVTGGEVRLPDGKTVSNDATVAKFAVGDSDIELVTGKVIAEGKNFVITTKKYGKMRVVFDDNLGATVWVTSYQRRELLKLATALPVAAAKAAPRFPDVVVGELGHAFGMSVNGPSSPSLWLKSRGPQKAGGWNCEGGADTDVVCFELVLTEKTIIPPSWRDVDGRLRVKSGQYSVRGQISGNQIIAAEVRDPSPEEVAELQRRQRERGLESEILEAAKRDDADRVKALLSGSPSLVFSKDGEGNTSLHRAAANGHKDVAELLLAHGADVNARDNDSVTPLQEAAAYGHKDVAELLLAHGADVNVKGNNGLTLLQEAAANGNKDMAEMLLRSKADVNAKEDNYGGTALHLAALKGQRDVAELLLASGADVNAKANNGLTPLHGAAGNGHKDVAELLLAHGADVNAKDNQGDTPLRLAVKKGGRDVAGLLLAHGADVNVKGNNGLTLLDEAAASGNKDVAELLLSKADVNAKDNYGDTPLHVAAFTGRKDVAELLLAHGADVNARDNKGDTPLQLAVKKGRRDVAELLRQHGGQE